MRTWLLIIILIFAPSHISPGQETNSFGQQCLADFQAGKISYSDLLLLQLKAVDRPHSLPSPYVALAPAFTRNTTALKAEVKRIWHNLSDAEKSGFAPYMQRPSHDLLPYSLISPAGLFKIHYASDGTNMAKDEYVQSVAAIFDSVYDYEINVLQFQPPPQDFNVDGPEYDVYLRNMADYGFTTSENPGGNYNYPYGYTSWVEIDNDFTHTPTKGYDALRVTAAHEFFHMIHIGYRSYETTELNCIFLFESCATWMEDMAFDQVNDYYFYLSPFFEYFSDSFIDRPFNSSGESQEYGLCIFHHMLSKKYGSSIVRSILEQFVHQEALPALDAALNIRGSNLTAELADFAVWNFFTGSRADTIHYYPEGEHYPVVEAVESLNFANSISFTGNFSQLTTKYYKLCPQLSGDYVVQAVFDDVYQWIYSVIVLTNPSYPAQSVTWSGNSSKSLEDIPQFSEIWIAPTFAQWPQSDFSNISEQFQFLIQLGNAPALADEIVSISPNPFIPNIHNEVQCRFQLSEWSNHVMVRILKETGQMIAQFDVGRCSDGFNKFFWDGRDSAGQLVASGIYLIYIETERRFIPAKLAVVR